MRFPIILTAAMLISACGQSNEEQLEDAANPSDPAAAEVLNGAGENGMNPQDALQEAGNAAAASNADRPRSKPGRTRRTIPIRRRLVSRARRPSPTVSSSKEKGRPHRSRPFLFE